MAGQADRELRSQRRKQANRDSAKRSKQRKKLENEELLVKADQLKAECDKLNRQLTGCRDRHLQLKDTNMKLRSQLAHFGVVLAPGL